MLLINRVRPFAIGAMLALTVLSLPAAAAHAEQKDPIPKVLCYSINQGDGGHDFFLPGETIIVADKDGVLHTLKCGDDGNWIDISRTKGPRSRAIQAGSGGPVLQP